MPQNSRITAVLGPTNTGKTHYAIERMLAYRTGIIGLPLRLLAREVYDKIVAARGPSVVALVTGEERIVPDRAQYWVCTVEAMPEGMGCDFLAVDEIQLCADPERGHVFTDRLLRARGTQETVFLGSDSMRPAIAALVPGVNFMRRERMSQLEYTGSRKISRMKPRSAVVGFSVDDVYAFAELIRRQKGGAAVVMGALSPRTRNAQVELYQNGDVDFLVATDAIGMGLNLDINHVAFSSTVKFDGRRMRMLMPNELAQIAGRAGRGMSDGTFGVTGEAELLDEGVAQAIRDHRFAPVRKLQWRNARLQFGTPDALIRSLEAAPDHEMLVRSRDADDLLALKSLSAEAEVAARASDGPSVKLLWDVCRVPDFRGISHSEHAQLLETIYGYLHEKGRVPNDWMARQVQRIDRTDGDIDTLSKRLSFIRTWTYVAQRSGWVDDESHWRGETRAVEDRLSDALHERLTQRFVDRRTSVLLRRLKQKEALLAEVNDKGEVTVEGEFVGRLEGFRFRQDQDASGQEAKTLRQASLQALAPHFSLRADRFYNAPDTEIDFTEQGGLMWGSEAVGKLVAGSDPLKPTVTAFVDDEAGADVAQKVERRLQHFIDRKIAALFEPLLALGRDEELSGLARGFAFQMVENLGVIPRAQVADDVKALDQDARGALRKHGIRFGQFTIFMPLMLKPAPTRLRLVLWALAKGLDVFPEAPPPGLVTVPTDKGAPEGADTMSGYRVAGERSIRIDMLERLADMLRVEDSRGGFEAKADMLSITGMTLEQFADLMQGLGYAAERGERAKVKAAPVAEAVAEGAEAPAETAEAPAEEASVEAVAEVAEAVETPAETADAAEPEVEVFFTFTWGGRRNQGGNRGRGRNERGGDRGADRGERKGGGKPRGKGGKPRGDGKGRGAPKGAKSFEARPPKKEKAIDPDNPFAAALMGLKKG
ncbi:helicase-related protein [Thalassovita mediterranea]|jgi:ATP-dependent RNA helicase SUPV3L1/SUV3|uniref:Superfamily II RNA helicase n=1 Tax=Thalassovita mediterranea TaxID=340021 RepID=A0A0P1GMV9_9RHOB|nr:helicase-related protein [Thalassovita mediterranea]CUH83725.1 Superfamily II RNA helicase [Thalassovita mediterranea]SIS28591.1 ATP-dependent RNA helicase SUPV3L1/SUV3 [Thalassovita mediterranea]